MIVFNNKGDVVMATEMLKGIRKKRNPNLRTLYVFHSNEKNEYLSFLDDGTPVDFYGLKSTKLFNVDLVQPHQIGSHAGFQKSYEAYIHNHQG
jgi:hypothetical protein